MHPQELERSFPNNSIPEELAKLLTFEQQAGSEYYSDGFELVAYPKHELSNWSSDDGFLTRVVPFAQANGSGSIYALWQREPNADLSQSPVVVFGDEGGVHVVAENLRALLHLLSFDAEPMVDWDEVTFFKGDDYHPSKRAALFAAWLQSEFGLSPILDADQLVTSAQDQFKAEFDTWRRQYVTS